ncbi:hypothetical protein [Fibrobacter sp. UWB4]|uniref:hypothetical protein n=1 Tax=Fibrobacter sp. UWB4 TaxID=1964356 RepID=UPI0020CC5E43|nr:hypothetical protein [Fibrobacter sp. UWB4]
MFLIIVSVVLFAVFPLTDTDIWWHLACARKWVTTWTPVREPVVNVHEYFQQVVAIVYDVGGAPLLVVFKAILWGLVFALFLRGVKCRNLMSSAIAVVILFIFRYQLEIRPVLFSLLFLGIYWNVLPWLFRSRNEMRGLCANRVAKPHNVVKTAGAAVLILAIQWLWCRFQGLYILGPLFALLILWANGWSRRWGAFVVLLFAMPLLHRDGLNLFLYPFGLLDRLLGLSPSAAFFASEIAENRSPITLLKAGENVLQSALMVVFSLAGIVASVRHLRRSESVWLLTTAILALVAERNFVLFLPVFFAVGVKCWPRLCLCKQSHDVRPSRLPNRLPPAAYRLLPTLLIAFTLGLWAKSLAFYDRSMVAYQRVPVAATQWMLENPHSGRLFNDDRAGGYLAFMNPSDSTFIDGRFILKTAEFFEKYLQYAESPQTFLHDADSLDIDRVVLPLRYYARWDKLLGTLDSSEKWHVAYRDSLFVVMDRTAH